MGSTTAYGNGEVIEDGRNSTVFKGINIRTSF
jgi:hypothetical protein